MLGFPLGILSAAGAGGVAGDYELIETQVLVSAVSSITFASLATYASDYKHLQIRIAARTDRAAIADSAMLRFNADSGGNYRAHWLQGTGSVVASNEDGSGATKVYAARTPAASAAANIFGGGVCDVLDAYSSTKNTTTRALTGYTASSSEIYLFSGLWINTAAITSATLIPNIGANFVTGSRFSLYGVRG